MFAERIPPYLRAEAQHSKVVKAGVVEVAREGRRQHGIAGVAGEHRVRHGAGRAAAIRGDGGEEGGVREGGGWVESAELV